MSIYLVFTFIFSKPRGLRRRRGVLTIKPLQNTDCGILHVGRCNDSHYYSLVQILISHLLQLGADVAHVEVGKRGG